MVSIHKVVVTWWRRLLVATALLAAISLSLSLFFGRAQDEPQDLTPLNRENLVAKETAFLELMRKADAQGNYRAAVGYARECHEMWLTLKLPHWRSSHCSYYYVNALVSGKGSDKNPVLAFKTVEQTVKSDYDDVYLVEKLVQFYLDGTGVARNPVEAAVVFWRFRHGKISEFFACMIECHELFQGIDELEARLNEILSRTERTKARSLEKQRFPDLYFQALFWDTFLVLLTFAVVVSTSWLVWKISWISYLVARNIIRKIK